VFAAQQGHRKLPPGRDDDRRVHSRPQANRTYQRKQGGSTGVSISVGPGEMLIMVAGNVGWPLCRTERQDQLLHRSSVATSLCRECAETTPQDFGPRQARLGSQSVEHAPLVGGYVNLEGLAQPERHTLVH
jgi:hypothetical protein